MAVHLIRNTIELVADLAVLIFRSIKLVMVNGYDCLHAACDTRGYCVLVDMLMGGNKEHNYSLVVACVNNHLECKCMLEFSCFTLSCVYSGHQLENRPSGATYLSHVFTISTAY